jgi:hypothetical protein
MTEGLFLMNNNKRIKTIVTIFIFIFILYNTIFPKYIPDPVLLIHGRGMKDDSNWNTINLRKADGTETNDKILDLLINEYKIPTYYNIFSGEGFGSIRNWGDELNNWVADYKNYYESIYGGGSFRKFRFVSYSAGGLASRWYLANYGSSYVDRLLTLNTPHQGAYLAVIGRFASEGPKIFFPLTVVYTGLSIAFPLAAPMYLAAAEASANLFAMSFILSIVGISSSVGLIPPPVISNEMDRDLVPLSGFFIDLKVKESNEANRQKIKYHIVTGNGGIFNIGRFEAGLFLAIVGTTAIPGINYNDLIPPIIALGIFMKSLEGDYASPVTSQSGEDAFPYGKWYVRENNYDIHIKKTNENHLDVARRLDLIIDSLDDPSSLAVENSNTLTAVKMEPDGAYINIQHPIIHIDGSCDDYLIQWMGDNDRVRLRYDKYANIDEVIKLKSTEEGVFDYQRAGDVGRGWFSQNKNKRKGV